MDGLPVADYNPGFQSNVGKTSLQHKGDDNSVFERSGYSKCSLDKVCPVKESCCDKREVCEMSAWRKVRTLWFRFLSDSASRAVILLVGHVLRDGRTDAKKRVLAFPRSAMCFSFLCDV